MSTPFATILETTDIDALLAEGSRISWDRIAPRLGREELSPVEFAALVMDDDDDHLEGLARHASRLRSQRFGNAIKLYAPLYLSNRCINACPYCNCSAGNAITRTTLTPDDILEEARLLIDRGHRHLLLVAGEDAGDRIISLIEYIAPSLRPRVASLAVEIQPTDEHGYRRLAAAGVDGVTLYQETYQHDAYTRVHASGPKADFAGRLASIEAAAQAGMRFLGIGTLLGLADWRRDAIAVMLHARYLQKYFWQTHISISVPRLRGVPDGFAIPQRVNDVHLVRLIVALRCALHDVGIALSTRESPALRTGLVPLGITQMSAGSRTEPGGYAHPDERAQQFSIDDDRSPAEVAESLRAAGFDPVFKDWEGCLHD